MFSVRLARLRCGFHFALFSRFSAAYGLLYSFGLYGLICGALRVLCVLCVNLSIILCFCQSAFALHGFIFALKGFLCVCCAFIRFQHLRLFSVNFGLFAGCLPSGFHSVRRYCCRFAGFPLLPLVLRPLWGFPACGGLSSVRAAVCAFLGLLSC